MNSPPILAIATVVAATFVLGAAHAAKLERWACKDEAGTTIWTIADNRMFVTEGKGALQVVNDTSSLTIAYRLSKTDQNDVISYVYILDKRAGKLIVYDDMVAAVAKGQFGQPFEPRVSISPCTLATMENLN